MSWLMLSHLILDVKPGHSCIRPIIILLCHVKVIIIVGGGPSWAHPTSSLLLLCSILCPIDYDIVGLVVPKQRSKGEMPDETPGNH